ESIQNLPSLNKTYDELSSKIRSTLPRETRYSFLKIKFVLLKEQTKKNAESCLREHFKFLMTKWEEVHEARTKLVNILNSEEDNINQIKKLCQRFFTLGTEYEKLLNLKPETYLGPPIITRTVNTQNSTRKAIAPPL
ncbi:MAG: hypothetical protein OEL89_04265, partial [Candidatus Peregrinibacteria bacterium]|nr:hypothetical protein [Candidatus Peregrinibacteria bacterium]